MNRYVKLWAVMLVVLLSLVPLGGDVFASLGGLPAFLDDDPGSLADASDTSGSGSPLVTQADMPGTSGSVPVRQRDVPVNQGDVPVTPGDIPVTPDDFLRLLSGPWLNLAVGALLSLLAENSDRFNKFTPKQKRAVFYAACFVVPLAATLLRWLLGYAAFSDRLLWDALVAGFVAAAGGTAAHLRKLPEKPEDKAQAAGGYAGSQAGGHTGASTG